MEKINRETIKDFRARFPDAPRAHRMAFKRLLSIADQEGLHVRILPLKGCRALIYRDRIGIAEGLTDGQMIYDLAHELGHHIDQCGNILMLPSDDEYKKYCERKADQTAKILLMALGFSDQEISAWA